MKSFAILALCGASLLAQAIAAPAPVPTSAKLVDRNPKIPAWEVGDIQVIYANGRVETITKDHMCSRPKVSGHGDVGWSTWIDHTEEPKYSHSGEILRVRFRDGTEKDFRPNSLFIQNWAFSADDNAVIIESMAHHGPESYIKFDLGSGKELGRVNGYVAYDKLPDWAKPVSDDKP